jgi:hypothetical protein
MKHGSVQSITLIDVRGLPHYRYRPALLKSFLHSQGVEVAFIVVDGHPRGAVKVPCVHLHLLIFARVRSLTANSRLGALSREY